MTLQTILTRLLFLFLIYFIYKRFFNKNFIYIEFIIKFWLCFNTQIFVKKTSILYLLKRNKDWISYCLITLFQIYGRWSENVKWSKEILQLVWVLILDWIGFDYHFAGIIFQNSLYSSSVVNKTFIIRFLNRRDKLTGWQVVS